MEERLKIAFIFFADHGKEMSSAAALEWLEEAGVVTRKLCNQRFVLSQLDHVKSTGTYTIKMHDLDAVIQRVAENYHKDISCSPDEAVNKIRTNLVQAHRKHRGEIAKHIDLDEEVVAPKTRPEDNSCDTRACQQQKKQQNEEVLCEACRHEKLEHITRGNSKALPGKYFRDLHKAPPIEKLLHTCNKEMKLHRGYSIDEEQNFLELFQTLELGTEEIHEHVVRPPAPKRRSTFSYGASMTSDSSDLSRDSSHTEPAGRRSKHQDYNRRHTAPEMSAENQGKRTQNGSNDSRSRGSEKRRGEQGENSRQASSRKMDLTYESGHWEIKDARGSDAYSSTYTKSRAERDAAPGSSQKDDGSVTNLLTQLHPHYKDIQNLLHSPADEHIPSKHGAHGEAKHHKHEAHGEAKHHKHGHDSRHKHAHAHRSNELHGHHVQQHHK